MGELEVRQAVLVDEFFAFGRREPQHSSGMHSSGVLSSGGRSSGSFRGGSFSRRSGVRIRTGNPYYNYRGFYGRGYSSYYPYAGYYPYGYYGWYDNSLAY